MKFEYDSYFKKTMNNIKMFNKMSKKFGFAKKSKIHHNLPEFMEDIDSENSSYNTISSEMTTNSDHNPQFFSILDINELEEKTEIEDNRNFVDSTYDGWRNDDYVSSESSISSSSGSDNIDNFPYNEEKKPYDEDIIRNEENLHNNINKKIIIESESYLGDSEFIKDLFLSTICIYAYSQFFVVFFSAMGIGIQFAIFSKKNMSLLSNIYLGTSIGIFYIMYIMGMFKEKTNKICLIIGLIIAGMFGTAGVLFKVDTYPYGPLCLFVFLLPSFLVIVSDVIQLLTHKEHTFRYTSKMYAISLPIVGISLAFRWIVWSLRTRNRWTTIRDRFGKRLNRNGFRCRRTYEENWMDDEDIKSLKPYSECTEIFLLWANPWAFSCVLFLYGAFFHVIRKPNMHNKLGALIIFVLIAIWVAASLAGAGHGIGNALIASTACAVAGIFTTGIITRGMSGTISWLKTNPYFISTMDKYIHPFINVWRGIITLSSWLFFTIIYIPTEYIRYKIRLFMKYDNIGPGPFTNEATNNIVAMSKWNWTEVCKYAFMVGVANIIIVVIVAKFTVLCMAYVVAASGSLSIWKATGIISITGMTLFLLPPVPGAPIYLAAGVLLPPIAKQHNWSIFGGICYTSTVCLVIKLAACTIQQKIIGNYMSDNLWVKQTVDINSDFIRTAKLILTEPGLSIAKISILVGGPDWPTSVLCGILKLSLAPILIGTLPVWILIWPTVLGGAFLVIEESYSQILSTIFIGLAAFVQSGSLVVAMYKLSQETESRKCELAMEPYDEVVLEATKLSNLRSNKLIDKLDWYLLPLKWRIVLIISIITMSISCYLTTLYPSECFKSFAINDKVSKKLDGKWTNIIRPLGFVSLVLFNLSSLLYGCYQLFYVRHIKNKIYDTIDENFLNNSKENNDVKFIVQEVMV